MRTPVLIFAIAMASTMAGATPKDPELGITVAEALAHYRSNDANWRSVEAITIIGMLYELTWANTMLAEVRFEQPLFCQPPRLSLTEDQVMAILATSVRDNPDVANKPLGYAIITELEKTFPCKKGEGPSAR